MTFADFSMLRFDFTKCNYFSVFFLQIFDVNFFPRTALPVGISMYIVTNTKKLAHPLQAWYVRLPVPTWFFLGTGTPTYFYSASS
jgi:hypothetical protein